MVALVTSETVIDAHRLTVRQQRSIDIRGRVSWTATAAIVGERTLPRQLRQLDREKARANLRRAVHPQPIVGEQRRELTIAPCTRDLAGEQLVAALAVEAVIEAE